MKDLAVMREMAGKYLGFSAVMALAFAANSAVAEGTASKAAPGPAGVGELVGKQAPSASEQVRTLPGGITLRIAPGSVVERLRSTYLRLGSTGTPTTMTHVVQVVSGRVTVSIPKTSGPPPIALLLQAPRKLSAVVTSGRGEVLVTPEAVSVAALEGEMVTAVNDAWRKLPEGQARSVDAKAAGGSQRKILSAPVLTAAQPLFLAPSDGAGSIEFGWTAISEAASYRVTVSGSDAGEPPIRQFNVASTTATVEGLAPGRYQISVAAVDRFGLSGKDSALNMRGLGIELPAGARQVGTTIELARRQRIHFTDPKGLEITYGTAPVFVPAPNDVGLAGDAPTLLRLRVSGERAELSLRLVPAVVHTGISIVTGAKGWPREAGKLRIAFRDGHGRLLPRAPEAGIEVRVNRLPVPMRWQRHGGIMEGTLAARGDWGPHSVGVRVTDKFGHEIGHEVLKIASAER